MAVYTCMHGQSPTCVRIYICVLTRALHPGFSNPVEDKTNSRLKSASQLKETYKQRSVPRVCDVTEVLIGRMLTNG